jgi:hypothetical protein
MAKNADGLAVTDEIKLSSWYVVCRSVLQAVRRATLHIDGHFADDVIGHYEGNRERADITFSRAVKVCRDGVERLVGYVFAMSAQFMSAWLRHCMYEVDSMI